MRVSEAVPRYQGQLQSFARGTQNTAKQVLWVERGLISGCKDEILRTSLPTARELRLKRITHRLADRNISSAAFRLRRTELAFRDCLTYLDDTVDQVNRLPSQRENFTDSHTRQYCYKHECAARFGKESKQLPYFLRIQKKPFCFWCTVSNANPSCWILFKKIPIDGGLQHFRNCSPHPVRTRTGEAILSFLGKEALNINARDVAKPP